MAYCRKHTHTHGVFETSAESTFSQPRSGTDQFEHPRAAAARGEAAEQAKDDDGGPGPDENIWRVGAFLRHQREIGLQADLPPHADGQQDHACELKITQPQMLTRVWVTRRRRFKGPRLRPTITSSRREGVCIILL